MIIPFRAAFEVAKDAAPAGACSGAASAVGMAAQAPPWLIALGQAVIVVYFTVRAIDKREKARNAKITELDNKVTAITGRLDRLEREGCAVRKIA